MAIIGGFHPVLNVGSRVLSNQPAIVARTVTVREPVSSMSCKSQTEDGFCIMIL
jgi:hypothetical protein